EALLLAAFGLVPHRNLCSRGPDRVLATQRPRAYFLVRSVCARPGPVLAVRERGQRPVIARPPIAETVAIGRSDVAPQLRVLSTGRLGVPAGSGTVVITGGAGDGGRVAW